MEPLPSLNACVDEEEKISRLYQEIPQVVARLVRAISDKDDYRHLGQAPMPSHDSVVALIHKTRRILFPGFFHDSVLNPSSLDYYMGQQVTELYHSLCKEIVSAMQYDCFKASKPCSNCRLRGHEAALAFIHELPALEAILGTDITAALEGDPAAKGADEVIFSYPGLLAITIYRMAHTLLTLDVPIIPRIMTEHAHSLTGIDIHPGARIGKSFFIDHGTGVVIGESTIIGDHVRIYQGVTLGALSLPRDAGNRYRGTKRHPTIEDNVTIYANTTILGGDTVIGANSIIGGNIWLTESVPPDTKVLMKRPELEYIAPRRNIGTKK